MIVGNRPWKYDVEIEFFPFYIIMISGDFTLTLR